MPRKASKSVSEIFDVLKDLHLVNDEGCVLNLTHSIWEEACIKLDNAMSKKYIYLYVSQNRNGLLHKLLHYYGIDCVKKNIRDNSASFNECSDQSNWSMPSSDNILPSLRTTIHLSSETWSKIEPINTLYKNRPYRVLNKGWTDVITEEL